MADRPLIVWLREDLRIADNPALAAAAATGAPVLPVYVLDDATPGRWRMGGAARWWLHGSLATLGQTLRQLGAPLILRQGPAAECIMRLIAETDAAAVYANTHPEPYWLGAESTLQRLLAAAGVTVHYFAAATLFSPGSVRSRRGQPLQVFTPFWRACRSTAAPAPLQPAPVRLRPPASLPASDDLATWSLRPTSPDWAAGLRAAWQPGEATAQQQLVHFLDQDLATYALSRDRPEPAATSCLSPRLHFGELSPRQVWHATLSRAAAAPALATPAEAFLRQLIWREYFAHTLHHSPQLPDAPLQPKFTAFPWREDAAVLRCWQRGETGYPIVDAGMRQLRATGWMHNRVRMITASFLVKHLLQPWQSGEAWFWDNLVDADLANNAGGWQWVAGCGGDAAPYFRIFNPTLQGERFDAEGAYVRRWLPELSRLPDRWLHQPWEAPPLELAAAGIRPGIDYPNRLIEHSFARTRAIEAFAQTKIVS